MVVRRVQPKRGFLVNTYEPFAAMIVIELRYGLNIPNDSPSTGVGVPGCQMMFSMLSWLMCPVSMSTWITRIGVVPMVRSEISVISSVGFSALTDGSIGAVVRRWL